MKALILNSGTGSRMGDLTKNNPKCMTELSTNETIISRQLRQLSKIGIEEIIITTGKYDEKIKKHCLSLSLPLKFHFIKNDLYDKTNYIYSIYLAKHLLESDIISLHGDLVFDSKVLEEMPINCMAISSKAKIPEKDFKAVLKDDKIIKVGINFFENSVMAQPMYKLEKDKWLKWLENISIFCGAGKTNVYAEDALNIEIDPFDFEDLLCAEIDTKEDLEVINERITSLR